MVLKLYKSYFPVKMSVVPNLFSLGNPGRLLHVWLFLRLFSDQPLLVFA